MRHIFLVGLLTLAATRGSAQPILHAENHIPLVGTMSFGFSQALTSDDPPGGENMVWDYTWLDGWPSDTTWYATPVGLPGGDSYPQATVASVDTLDFDTIPTYKWTNAEGLWESKYQPNYYCEQWIYRHLLPGTLEYGETFTNDNYGGGCSGDPGYFAILGEYVLTVDGWGTVNMPWGAVGSILRVSYVDEFTVSGPSPSVDHHFRTVGTRYYHEALIPPLVSTATQFHRYGSSNQWQPWSGPGVSYRVDITLGIETATHTVMSLHPNPVKDRASLTSNQLFSGSRIVLADASGRYIRSWGPTTGGSSIELDLSGLETGYYMAHVVSASGLRSCTRLCKE